MTSREDKVRQDAERIVSGAQDAAGAVADFIDDEKLSEIMAIQKSVYVTLIESPQSLFSCCDSLEKLPCHLEPGHGFAD
jgi:hypothetical protein